MTREAVSACLVVKDEASFLAPCLRSLEGWVDEVVVADTGSTDATPDLAIAAGAKVLKFPWTGSFADARNAVAAAATGTWILVIDADERLVPPGRRLSELLSEEVDCLALHLHNLRSLDAATDRPPEAADRLGHPVLVPRLFRRSPDLLWEGLVHELPVSWLRERRARLAPAPLHLLHLGYAPEVWASRDKAARNGALLRRQVIRDPADPGSLVLLAQHHLRCGRVAKAVAAAEAAWSRVAVHPSAPPILVSVVGTVLHAWAKAGRLDRYPEVLVALDRWGEREAWVRTERLHPNLLHLFAYGEEVHAVSEVSPRARMARLQSAARAHWGALQGLATPRMTPVLDAITEPELRSRHQLVVHQLGQRGFVRRTLADGVPASELDRALLGFELAVADGEGAGIVDAVGAVAAEHGDREAWVVAAAAARAVGDRDRVERSLAEAERRATPTWRAGHRAFLARDLAAWLGADPGLDQAVFVGGAGRSGTTLMRAMLGAHPGLFAPPELKLLPEAGGFYERLAAFRPTLLEVPMDLGHVERAYLRFVRSVLEAVPSEGRRVVEKTPGNVLHMDLLARVFPGARFVHLIRDGRDVVSSLLDQDWVDPSSGEPLAICREAGKAAEYWRETVLRARCQSAWLLGRVLEVRYEELVARPEAVMRRVLGFLGEPWDGRVMRHAEASVAYSAAESSSPSAHRPVFGSSVGRWRERLSAGEVGDVEAVAGDMLRELGYEA